MYINMSPAPLDESSIHPSCQSHSSILSRSVCHCGPPGHGASPLPDKQFPSLPIQTGYVKLAVEGLRLINAGRHSIRAAGRCKRSPAPAWFEMTRCNVETACEATGDGRPEDGRKRRVTGGRGGDGKRVSEPSGRISFVT